MGVLKDYFSFSKRERTGAIVLIILIVVVFLLPEFFPAPKSSVDANAMAEFKRLTNELRVARSDSIGEIEIRKTSKYEQPLRGAGEKAKLFYFDPNTISEDGWRKLGISDRTIETIKRYISKGGSFRRAEDLAKVYGISNRQYDQLRPFVQIQRRDHHQPHKYENSRQQDDYTSKKHYLSIVDINEADTSMLIALPGIGSKLANRIISFRDKLGGFHSSEQVREVFGIHDSTFQKIIPYLKCDASRIQQLDINTTDATDLKNHPYIKWNVANAIVNYRKQHGNFKGLNELLQIEIISHEAYKKIIPYLKVDQ